MSRLSLSQPTTFLENLHKILKKLEKYNCFEKIRSMTKRFTQRTVPNAVSKRVARRLKKSDGKKIYFKNFDFVEKE